MIWTLISAGAKDMRASGPLASEAVDNQLSGNADRCS